MDNPIDRESHPSYSLAMKKRYLIPLGLLYLALSSCAGCLTEEPSVQLRRVSLHPRSLTEIQLILELDVQNPNRFDLTIQSLQYKLLLNEREIGSGRLEKEILAPALSTTRIQAPVTAGFKNWNESLRAVIADKDIPYRIEGEANVRTIFGSIAYPFSRGGKIE